MEKATAKGVEIILPCDFACSSKFGEDGKMCVGDDTNGIPDGFMGLDCGPKSILANAAAIRKAKTIIWNGPMGVFEMKSFEAGTKSMMDTIVEVTKTGTVTVIGGGDTATACKNYNTEDKVTHCSTGGGASLELLEGKVLPGIAALDDAQTNASTSTRDLNREASFVEQVAHCKPNWEKYPVTQANAMSLNLLEVGAPALKTKLMMVGQPSIVQGCMDALTLKEEEPVQWMLKLLYDILREDSSCFSVFEEALKRKAGFCAPLMQILKSKAKETPTDVCMADKSAWLLSAIMAHVPGCFSNGDVLELVGAVTNQPRCSELGVLETITNLLKSDVFRGVVWSQGNVKDVINSVNVKTAEASVVYKYVFSIWLLSFDAGLAEDLKALKVVDKLRDIIAVNRVEKVVRISLTALSNLLPSKELREEIVESNVLDSVQNLEYEK